MLERIRLLCAFAGFTCMGIGMATFFYSGWYASALANLLLTVVAARALSPHK